MGRCSLTSDVEGAHPGAAPAAGDAATDQCGAERTRPEDFGALRRDRAPVHSARAPSASFASAASLIDPLGSGNWSNGWSSTCCFAWFVGLRSDEKVFDASTFSKNRDRLLTHEIAQGFLASLLGLPEVKRLLSAEHFSVDGTLLKAWKCSTKSFRPKNASGEGPGSGPGEPPPGRNREIDFRKTKRSNATHASTTDKDARLYRKGAGQESCLGRSRPHADGEPQRARGGSRGDLGERNGRVRGGGGFQPALAQGQRRSAPTRAMTPGPSSRA